MAKGNKMEPRARAILFHTSKMNYRAGFEQKKIIKNTVFVDDEELAKVLLIKLVIKHRNLAVLNGSLAAGSDHRNPTY